MAKIHNEKFSDLGGTRSALNPVVNIKVGSMILKEYVKRDGSIEGGLKRYVGAAAMNSDGGYGDTVVGEYDRLKAGESGKRISIFSKMKGRTATKVKHKPAETKIPTQERTNEKN